jgi:protein YibB
MIEFLSGAISWRKSMGDITVVTAFFDIGRGSLPSTYRGRALPFHQHRSVDTYFDFFKNLAKIKNDLIVYTTANFAKRIYEIRKEYGLEKKTKVVVCDSYLPEKYEPIKTKIEKIMNDPAYYGKVVNPQLIEYWHSDYVLVNIFKSHYVSDAIEKGLVHTDLAAWIDFGYCREPDRIPEPHTWSFNFDTEKIHFFCMRPIEPERPIDSIIYTGDVYIQGCHIVAGTKKWSLLKEHMFKSLSSLLSHNLIDDDQTLLLLSFLMNPENYQLHQANPNDWFIIFKVYNDAQRNLQTV